MTIKEAFQEEDNIKMLEGVLSETLQRLNKILSIPVQADHRKEALKKTFALYAKFLKDTNTKLSLFDPFKIIAWFSFFLAIEYRRAESENANNIRRGVSVQILWSALLRLNEISGSENEIYIQRQYLRKILHFAYISLKKCYESQSYDQISLDLCGLYAIFKYPEVVNKTIPTNL